MAKSRVANSPEIAPQRLEKTGSVPNMPLRNRIIAQLELVAREQGRPLAALTDDLVLLESGLDSLCFAIVVSRLQDELGLDPFSAAEEVDFPVTLKDFIRLYENAAPA